MIGELPPHILGPVVLAGVTTVAAVTWALGWSEKRRIETVQDGLSALPEGVDVAHAQLADGVVLVATDRGVLAVFGLGDRTVVRDVTTVQDTGDGLRLGFADFGVPRRRVAIPDEGERAAWAARVGG